MIIRFFIEKYVFRRIKLIYKIITDSKDSLESFNTDSKYNISIDAIQRDVAKWKSTTDKEISSLKTLETYRKEYLGNVSHELKTPLFSIQGYLHTLLEGGLYDDNINMSYLDRAVQNVSRLQRIVEDLEMINRLESEPGLDETSFDIKKLTQEVFNDLAILAKENNIELMFKPGADKSVMVYADKDKIRQVLINLINNTIKYSNESGQAKVSFYDMDDLILVEISDKGIGMSEEDAKHVFDRFYRVDKSRSRKVGGSGLGLAIVKHIIEAHNQKVVMRSTLGKGSTFGFTLNKI